MNDKPSEEELRRVLSNTNEGLRRLLKDLEECQRETWWEKVLNFFFKDKW